MVVIMWFIPFLLSSVESVTTMMRSICSRQLYVVMDQAVSEPIISMVLSHLHLLDGTSWMKNSWRALAIGWATWSSVPAGVRMVTIISVISATQCWPLWVTMCFSARTPPSLMALRQTPQPILTWSGRKVSRQTSASTSASSAVPWHSVPITMWRRPTVCWLPCLSQVM